MADLNELCVQKEGGSGSLFFEVQVLISSCWCKKRFRECCSWKEEKGAKKAFWEIIFCLYNIVGSKVE